MRYSRSFLVAFSIAALAAFAADRPTPQNSPSPSKKPRVLVTISKQTTYITEPLRPDGYPDYVAALNLRCSQGVTPENNASVLMWKAVGPNRIEKDLRARYFQMLGISPLPETGDYFIKLMDYANLHKNKQPSATEYVGQSARHKIELDLETAASRPWSKEEFPMLADWLAANEKPLALFMEASKRPRRYDPAISVGFEMVLKNTAIKEQNTVVGVTLPAINVYSELAVMSLSARAMLKVHNGEIDSAWEDLIACHRLSRLVAQGPFFADIYTAQKMDFGANVCDRSLLAQNQLTALQIKKMKRDLQKLPILPHIADAIDIECRLSLLDCVAIVVKNGLGELPGLYDSFSLLDDSSRFRLQVMNRSNSCKRFLNIVGKILVDWDVVFRMGNFWYDRVVEAYRQPDRRHRKEMLAKIDEELDQLASAYKNPIAFGLRMRCSPRKTMSDFVGLAFVALFFPTGHVDNTAYEDRWAMQGELTKVAFSLAEYRAEHDAYPAKLLDLTPKYIVEFPKDIFNDAELHYQTTSGGYILYSVGPNGTDDGGKTHTDAKNFENWDDLVVKMPAPNP